MSGADVFSGGSKVILKQGQTGKYGYVETQYKVDNNIPTAVITIQGTAVVYDSSSWWANYLTITTAPDGVTVALDTDHNINLSVSSDHNVTAILKGDGNGNAVAEFYGQAVRQGSGEGDAVSYGDGEALKSGRGVGQAIQLTQKPN